MIDLVTILAGDTRLLTGQFFVTKWYVNNARCPTELRVCPMDSILIMALSFTRHDVGQEFLRPELAQLA